MKGVISSVKDTYGFIERADLVKEIFFHFSEFPGRPEEIKEGVELEFTVQPHRNVSRFAFSCISQLAFDEFVVRFLFLDSEAQSIPSGIVALKSAIRPPPLRWDERIAIPRSEGCWPRS